MRLPRLSIAFAFALAALYAPVAHAEFTVNPVRVDLGPQSRSGAIVVRNDGKVPLGFQMQAMEWTQDAEGKDQYADSPDLIFFPKIMTIAPGEEGVIRVGARTTLVQSEKTYRLFIEQLPAPKDPNQPAPLRPGAAVSLLIRFGAPVFIAPAEPRDAVEFGPARVQRGELNFSLRNTGNRHHIIQGIDLRGTDAQGAQVWTLTLADRYLLAGAAKPYSTAIPPALCARIASLTIDLKTDKSAVQHKIDVNRAMCP